MSFRVDGERHPDPLTMACCSRNAPFAFTSTTQSRRGSLPSAHLYAPPFSSKYPHLAALGDFLYHKHPTLRVRDNGMVQRHKRVFGQRSTHREGVTVDSTDVVLYNAVRVAYERTVVEGLQQQPTGTSNTITASHDVEHRRGWWRRKQTAVS